MTKPSPIALVVCDNVYRESGGKTALVGLFDRIQAAKFPVKHPRLCVYAAVADIRPKTEFKLDVVNSETEHVVMSLGGPPPEGVSPLTVLDMTFELCNLVFPEPGLYIIRLWGNDHPILERPFEVTSLPETKRTEDQ